MSSQIVPVNSNPNSTIIVNLGVNGATLTLQLSFHYNEIAQYWEMTINDSSGNLVLASIPLITGDDPAGNILRQYEYLGIGSATVVNAGQVPNDYPNNTQLGGPFQLLW